MNVIDSDILGGDDLPEFLDRRHELNGQHNANAGNAGGAEVSSQAEADQFVGDDAGMGAGGDSDVMGADDGGEQVEWVDIPADDRGRGDMVHHVGDNFGGELDPQAAVEHAAEEAVNEEVVERHERLHDAYAPNERAVIGGNNPPPEPLTKEQMMRDFNRDIAAYGRDSGRGASALPRLGLRVIRAAYDGLISNEKPKTGKSDAVRIYEAYATHDSKHAEHTKGGMKANAAKLNALIGLGAMTTVDGVEVAERTVSLREKLEGADAKPKALFAGLVDVARAQMAQDTPLTDAQIEEALGKKQTPKTLAGEWEAINKKVEKLISGENPDGLQDKSDRAEQIYGMIKEHLNAFGVNEQREKDVAWLMQKGLTREQALEIASK